MEIFNILDHLHMADGYRLAYYYHYDSMGAYPVLYAIEIDQPFILSEKDYQEERPQCFSQENGWEICNYLQFVVVDGSPLSYLQLIQLSMMGNQFYLNWHANYNDCIPIATIEELHHLVDDLSKTDFGIPLTQRQIRKALSIDPEPVVNIRNEITTMRIVWFTHWGGFFETTYQINTNGATTITDEEITPLLEYDCGIRY
jgi:hypothetical protein